MRFALRRLDFKSDDCESFAGPAVELANSLTPHDPEGGSEGIHGVLRAQARRP
jgi:hypothetical protein